MNNVNNLDYILLIISSLIVSYFILLKYKDYHQSLKIKYYFHFTNLIYSFCGILSFYLALEMYNQAFIQYKIEGLMKLFIITIISAVVMPIIWKSNMRKYMK